MAKAALQEIRLSQLGIDHIRQYDAWKVLINSYEQEELILSPADKDEHGRVLKQLGEVWCLSKAIFSDKTIHFASCMCRGDSAEGPLLLSIFSKDLENPFIPLVLPPAPDFVLEADGPGAFCRQFDKTPEEVFPLTFEVMPEFETAPRKRSVLIHANGKIDPLHEI